MTLEELDREISDMQSVLGGLKMVGTTDKDLMRGLMERLMAMQAERRALAVQLGGKMGGGTASRGPSL